MGRSGPEVADVFRRYGEAYREHHGGSLSTAQRRVMTAIEICRTAALGGHVAVRQLRSSAHLLLKLPQSALPEVPITGPRPVAG
jgi:hypothetical protein